MLGLSFEFFPPKTEQGHQKLTDKRRRLSDYDPDFFSVTFGAGGSTRDGTLRTVMSIKGDNQTVAPHMACIGLSRKDARQLLDHYKNNGIDRVVALRGDLPSGMGKIGLGESPFEHASDLVSFIREEFGSYFHIDVAAYPEIHPQAQGYSADLDHFINKVKAGADSAITQYFFNIDSLKYFFDSVHSKGVDIPIIPGVLPITNYSKLRRFSSNCGAEIPRWLLLRLEQYENDLESLYKFGLDVITDICYRLIHELKVEGLHFYTLNGMGFVSEVCDRLNIKDLRSLKSMH